MTSKKLFKKALIATSISFVLSACGGGGGSESSNSSNPVSTTPSNVAPTATAGQDQSVEVSAYSGLTITLSGTASDSDGTIQSIKWEDKTIVPGQEGIELLDSDKLAASFKFNNINITQEQIYTLSLTITDDDGATTSDEVVVTVSPNTPIDVSLPDNINGARLVLLSEDTILISGGCKKLQAELREVGTVTYGCLEPSYKSFILNLNNNNLTQVGDANFARPYSTQSQSTTLLSDGRVVLYSQDNGLRFNYTGIEVEPNFDEYAKHFGEIYDPSTQQFTTTASMNEMRNFPMPARLSDDTVLFFTGTDNRKGFVESNPLLQHTKTIEMFKPESNSWELMTATYPELYDELITATLAENKVLLVGGRDVLGGGTNKAYIYDHDQQLVTEIETYIPTGSTAYVNNNNGASVQRVDLEDGSICLVPQGSGWLIRFDPEAQVFNYDTTPCEQWYSLGGFVRDGEVFQNGKVALTGAAHVEIKSGETWLSQQIVDLHHVPAQYNVDDYSYEFTQPMTIRIVR